MGFYSANTPEQKRVKQLTGDININDMFKNECNTRGIPIYNAYNIQKRRDCCMKWSRNSWLVLTKWTTG